MVGLGAVVALVTLHEADEHDKHQRDERRFLRQEAHELIGYCNMHAFAAQIGMATSKLGAYIARDRPHASEVLAGVVMPVIDAHELACTSAQHDLERLVAEDDTRAGAELQTIDAAVAVVARTRAAADAFGSAVAVAGESGDELNAKASAIRTAAGN